MTQCGIMGCLRTDYVKQTSGVSIVKLLADGSGVRCIPTIVTHRSPFPADAHLYSALVDSGAIDKLDCSMSAVDRAVNCVHLICAMVRRQPESLLSVCIRIAYPDTLHQHHHCADRNQMCTNNQVVMILCPCIQLHQRVHFRNSDQNGHWRRQSHLTQHSNTILIPKHNPHTQTQSHSTLLACFGFRN